MVKEKLEFAGHVFKKAIIQLTPEKLDCHKESVKSVTTTPLYLRLHQNFIAGLLEQRTARYDGETH